jgi:acyl-coenzyme A synthetase/AMP-(fatty) acid ligase
MEPFPPWEWRIPERFNIGVACTDVHVRAAVAEREAVVVDDDVAGTRSLTYRELAERTSRVAAVLRTLGVGVGDRVLIRLPNCLEYGTAFLGTLKRGAIAVPTSTMLTRDEVEYLARDSGAVAMVTDAATWRAMHAGLEASPALRHVLVVGRGADARGTRIEVHDFDRRVAGAEPDAPHDTRAEDPAYLVYTSGTTGYPKGVLHAHRALLGRQPSSEYWFDFDARGDRVLHAGKYNWTYVLGTGLMDPLYRGHTAIVCEGAMDAASWPRRIARHRATIFIAVPTVYRQILQKTLAIGADVPTLRHCMSAGEQLPAQVLDEWRARFGLAIYEGLGMTECSYYLCATRSRPIRPGSAGFAQPGHAITLRDPATWSEVADDAEGMMCIPRDDPGLMLRYWNQPEETARAFHGDWFLTGDYARRDADGYVWFLGRKDDLINTFGYRVSPFEVERVLKGHPDVGEVAAVGEEVGPGKIVVAAYVIARAGAALGPDAVLAYAREHLASYKAPRIVYLVDDFPRTRNGKVLRRGLAPALARVRAAAT